MAVIGIFTDTGINKSREAQENEGFKIFPDSFAVSNEASPSLVPTITTANAGVFFTGSISSYVAVSTDTVQINCVISPGQSASLETIREIYVYATDVSNNQFLLAVGQPENTSNIIYDPTGETTLRLQFTLVGANLSELYEFAFTQASEISQHNQDANAHSVIQNAMKEAGIYTQPAQHNFVGQHFDPFATFEGSVVDNDLVYKDSDNIYKKALYVEGALSSKVTGVANVSDGVVYANGLIDNNHGFAHGTNLYLSSLAAGQLSDVQSGVPIGHALDENVIAFRVDHKNSVDSIYDAVVSDVVNYKHYLTYEDAIAAVPNGGWIRVDKLQPLKTATPLNFGGKRLNLFHSGSGTGLEQFGGANEIQRIDFNESTPDVGKFNLVHEGNKTSDLAFNASAAQVKSALEALASINEVSVAGDMTNGFSVEFSGVDGLQPQSAIEGGTDVGVDEIQRLNFDSTDFAGGSFKLELDGQQTAAIAFNSINATTIQTELNGLPNLSSVSVTLEGSPPAGDTEFIISFEGADGKQDQSLLVVPAPDNSLVDSLANPINITPLVDTEGVLPDVTLEKASAVVSVVASTTVEGELPGSLVGIELDANGSQIVGHGRIKDFTLGIDLNTHTDTRIEMIFDNCVTAIERGALIEGVDFSTDGSIGAIDFQLDDATLFREVVRVDPSPVADENVSISSAEIVTNDGSKWGLTIEQFVCSYAGGSVNFATGVVSGAGDNFTPYTPSSPSQYFKYGVALTVNSEILIIPPVNDAASAGAAGEPIFENVVARAVVTVQDDGSGASGTILPIAPDAIKRFFTNTTGVKVVKTEEFITVGGETTFDVSTFEWSTSHSVLDIEVFVNGMKQTMSQLGDLSKDFRKLDKDTIEFSYALGANSRVDITYIGDATGASSAATGLTRKYSEIADGIKTIFTPLASDPLFTWSTSNDTIDIDVFLNGVRQEQGAGNDYTKISNNQIQFEYTPPVNTKVVMVSRAAGSASSASNGYLFTENEGSLLSTNTIKYNFTGSLVTASETSPGEIEVNVEGAEVNTVSNEGTGNGEIFIQKTGANFELRNIIAGAGIQISLDANNNIVIGLAQSVFFHESLNGFSGVSVTVPNIYDIATNKLNVYRNGVLMHLSNTIGIAAARYLESSANTITLFDSAETDDVFSFVNVTQPPAFETIINNQSGTVLTVPEYTLGTGRLQVYRNGILMNTAGLDTLASRYSETSTTSITLIEAAVPSDVFVIEHLAVAPNFIEYVTSALGTTVNLAVNTYTLGTDKLLVFRNGILMNLSSDLNLGDVSSRYLEASSSSITLESPGSNASDTWTFIELA